MYYEREKEVWKCEPGAGTHVPTATLPFNLLLLPDHSLLSLQGIRAFHSHSVPPTLCLLCSSLPSPQKSTRFLGVLNYMDYQEMGTNLDSPTSAVPVAGTGSSPGHHQSTRLSCRKAAHFIRWLKYCGEESAVSNGYGRSWCDVPQVYDVIPTPIKYDLVPTYSGNQENITVDDSEPQPRAR
ncbi:hypothetical protein C8R44DRAFT_747683 [Mycena epipterygia]|nr:hypothetical protein C8R44DRAFT_747683 [Mycena epipterygia]